MGKPQRPRIPGTIRALNAEVLRLLMNRDLSVKQRGELAAAVITAKVLTAYRIGETK